MLHRSNKAPSPSLGLQVHKAATISLGTVFKIALARCRKFMSCFFMTGNISKAAPGQNKKMFIKIIPVQEISVWDYRSCINGKSISIWWDICCCIAGPLILLKQGWLMQKSSPLGGLSFGWGWASSVWNQNPPLHCWQVPLCCRKEDKDDAADTILYHPCLNELRIPQGSLKNVTIIKYIPAI